MTPAMSFTRRCVHIARDCWIALGIALLCFVGAEVLYRLAAPLASGVLVAQAGTRRVPSTHPYADSAWYPAFVRELNATSRPIWQPFLYFRDARYHGTYFNIDSSGLRVVPRYPVPGGKPL